MSGEESGGEGKAVVEVEGVTNPESLPYDSNSFFFRTLFLISRSVCAWFEYQVVRFSDPFGDQHSQL